MIVHAPRHRVKYIEDFRGPGPHKDPHFREFPGNHTRDARAIFGYRTMCDGSGNGRHWFQVRHNPASHAPTGTKVDGLAIEFPVLGAGHELAK